MSRAFNSPGDGHDDHMRNLLDQRHVRADFQGHGRFPSLSEFSDSPSVYSHAYFSPHPPDKRELEANANSFHFDIPPHRMAALGEHRLPVSNRDRLNDPTASSLDLDDESSTGASVNMADVEDEDTEYGDNGDSAHRISLQGPKIRFHSRAPWEAGGDSFEDEDSDHSGRSGAFTKKSKGKSSKADSLMKTFGRGTSIVSRRSGESSRSQAPSKASFEITAGNYSSSRGALYALAQESMSTSSLSVPSPSSSTPSTAVRQNFSLPRTSQYPPSGYPTSQIQESFSRAASGPRAVMYPSRSSSAAQDTQASSSPTSDAPRSYDRSTTPSSLHSSQERTSQDDFVHPYANPDLVMSYVPTSTPISPQRAAFGNMARSDSSTTVTDTLNSRSAVSAITPNTSTASLAPREQAPLGNSRIQGKEISSPIAVLRANDMNAAHVSSHERSTKLLSVHPPSSGMTGVPGWNNQPSSPSVTLISLQEAQARERSRSANTAVSPLSNAQASSSHIPFPQPDETGGVSRTSGGDPSPSSGMRARARSISAGARAKNAIHSMVVPQLPKPERRDSEPAEAHGLPGHNVVGGRALKHKKSGFMRLFNGREREKEKSLPPPVPSLSDIYTDFDLQHGAPKARAATLPRVPVPTLSPSLMEANSGTTFCDEPETMDQTEPEHDEFVTKQYPSPPRKRDPPPLFIMTGATGGRSPASIHESSFQPRTAPGDHLTLPSFQDAPQSAPPGTTEFQGLKLRPISTTFSAHFADIVASPEEELNPEFELELPSSGGSSSTAISPLTPGFSRRSDEKQSGVVIAQGEQSSVVKALQEQMVSAKKAWQRQLWELQGQVRDLKAEVEELRAMDNRGHCEACGRGESRKECNLGGSDAETRKTGVVNRPRARTGDAARFGSGH
ncbi:hypothetical protein BV22DRAFT_1058670 [Leucogyrophana mollusca]|uniref:Uncharacterized protein n=1 Tax=Leucogyrophana mollusca TaxID=85980 RepID=A0ACB8BSH2_9AGAM|nr:hypothetical protein BV22DRAFT_1058670 [Leucogyrophana mollusca]